MEIGYLETPASRDHEIRPWQKSFLPLKHWKYRIDAQQAFLELWWRDFPKNQKYRFSQFKTVQEQSEQFFQAVNIIHAQMRNALNRKLSPDQEAQYQDAVYFIKSQIEHNLTSETLSLDFSVEVHNNAAGNKEEAIIPQLHLERTVLERLVARFLLEDYFYCEWLPAGGADDWESFAKEMQGVERQRERERDKQITEELNNAYEAAIAINSRRICDLRTQNDWRFEAWRLFVVSCFIREEGLYELPVPLFYLCDPDAIVKQELEAHWSRDLLKSRTFLMWQDYREERDINQWVNDTLTGLEKMKAIDSECLFVAIASPWLNGRILPLRGWPLRYWLYAALFKRLLLDPPEWVKALPEQSITNEGQQNILTQATPEIGQKDDCPYDLSRLTTIEQKERFFYIFEKKRTSKDIQDKFKINRIAWNKSKKALNEKLSDCEISYQNGYYEVVPLSVE